MLYLPISNTYSRSICLIFGAKDGRVPLVVVYLVGQGISIVVMIIVLILSIIVMIIWFVAEDTVST